MRYAIVSSGGKQYVAREGEALEVDRLHADGQAFEFSEVLLAAEGDQVLVGTPTVQGAKVKARIVGEVKGKKIDVFRYQPKKRRRRMLGHRQIYSRLMIEEIDLPGVARKEPAPAPQKKAAAAKKPAPAARKAAARPPKAVERAPAGAKPKAKPRAAKKKGS